jgi:multiple sugar transport system permease protein
MSTIASSRPARPPRTYSDRAPYADEIRTAWAMLAPAAILLILFLIIPFLMAFVLSLTNQRLISPNPAQFVGLENYQEMLALRFVVVPPEIDPATNQPRRDEAGNLVYPRARTVLRGDENTRNLSELAQFDLLGTHYILAAGDPVFWLALRNTFGFVLIVVPLQTAFALGLAILINQKIAGVNFFRTVYFSPVVTTMAVVSVLWFFLYNPDFGLINSILGIVGIGPFDWLNSPDSALFSIILLSIWQGVGFQMVIFLAGLQEIPEELYEAAQIDGASVRQRFLYVTLPSLRNTTTFVVVSTTILAFKLFVQVDVMTFQTGGPFNSTVTTILHLVNEGYRKQRVGYAAAISVVFVLLVILISVIQRQYLTRVNK